MFKILLIEICRESKLLELFQDIRTTFYADIVYRSLIFYLRILLSTRYIYIAIKNGESVRIFSKLAKTSFSIVVATFLYFILNKLDKGDSLKPRVPRNILIPSRM